MKKETITISVDKNTTREEINEIRSRFKNSKRAENYKLNIIISGEDDMKKTLGNFLISKLKS